MKAIIQNKYGGSEALHLQEIDTPLPLENQVRVKVYAAAVNDYDWCMMRGKPYLYRLMFGITRPKNRIPGMEISGVIDRLGEQATKFKIGEAVYGDISEYGFGGFAEYVCVNENALAHKPENMNFNDAASIPHASMLAVQGLIDIGNIQKGQKVLINGAGGGVGNFGLLIAKQYNAQVTGVDTEEKLELMSSIGYDQVIDYKKTNFTKNCCRYDLILDTKTTRSPFAYLSALAPGGKYVTVGGNLLRLLQIAFLKHFISVFFNKSISLVALKANKNLDYIEELYDEGKIKIVIDGPHRLGDVPDLVQYFGEGKHKGKIIVCPDA